MCGSNLSYPLPPNCPNCGANTQNMEIGGIVSRQRDPRGKQYNPYGTDKTIQVAAKKKKKTPRLGDYVSEEFKTCKDVIMYSDYKNYDDEEVEKSCTDLAIDG